MAPLPSPPPPSPRPLLILYGSETGTAADLAQELSRLFSRHHFTTTTLSASGLAPLSSLPTWPTVVFITATTGQGDMPANTTAFWKFLLRKKLPNTWLAGTEFTTFGCGDSSYTRFNWAVRKVHKRLLQLGAREMAERGEGDEQNSEGLDGAFLPWSARLLEVLLEKYPLPEGVSPIPADQLLPPKWLLSLTPDAPAAVYAPADAHILRPNAVLGTIAQNTRVTPETHWQDVRHITIALPEPVPYGAGDTLSFLPQNHPDDVTQLLDLQGWTDIADAPLELTPNPALPLSACPIPHPVTPLTLRTLLTHHLDLAAVPQRSFFSLIAPLTTDPTQQPRLLEFTQPLYTDELHDYSTRPRRSILEVLQEFHTVRIPLPHLLSTLPPLHPRLFSIASTPRGCTPTPVQHTHTVDILAAIVRYQTIIKRTRHGLCTRWLSSLPPGAPVSVVFNPGTLVVPAWDKPALMVAPGTGIAPMRALVWERAHRGCRDSVVLFGGRARAADFYFEREWGEAGASVFAAFSREGGGYVQGLVRREREAVWRVISGGGVVYVCGRRGGMAEGVREAVVEVVRGMAGVERGVAEEVVRGLERGGRWREETW